MAKVTNAFATYQAQANREDLSDVIYNIDYSAIGLESGVYSVRLTSSTEQVVQKLIVNK